MDKEDKLKRKEYYSLKKKGHLAICDNIDGF